MLVNFVVLLNGESKMVWRLKFQSAAEKNMGKIGHF